MEYPQPKLLVVDDDPQVRTWVRQMLKPKGFQVEEAGDWKEALASIERTEPILVVLNYYMPDMDGVKAILYLRTIRRAVKILAICGHVINGYDLTQPARALGVHGTLNKPIVAEEFLQRVESLLS